MRLEFRALPSPIISGQKSRMEPCRGLSRASFAGGPDREYSLLSRKFWEVILSQVYLMEKDSKTEKLERIYCQNEDKELQQLLENNLDHLLPGDQISPGQNLRWLLVKREMPVVNAASGEPGLSIDFLLVDQYGVPTLVECKRQKDGRARREVVGQILEYAASGRNYWSAAEFLRYARTTAGDESKLLEKLKELTEGSDTPEDFFSRVAQNLKDYKIRCILFLEGSPLELRNIVEFLNGQMKDIELLIVEARLYQQGNSRIVVPWVFGFTEEARAAKRESKAETVRASVEKGEDSFWEGANDALGEEEGSVDQLREFIAALAEIPSCELTWLKSCTVSLPAVVPGKIILGLRRDGSLELYLDRWRPLQGVELTREQSDARDAFLMGIESLFGIPLSKMLASRR